MAYCVASDIFAICPHLFGSASGIDTGTSPTLVQVNMWLSTGSSLIDAKLAFHGYGSIPITSAVYGVAQQANAAYGAWWAERSRLSARVSVTENTRDKVFKKDFTDLLDMLVGKDMDLSMLGVARSTLSSLPYAGGISVTDKDTNYKDTSIVQGRFQRDQFDNPEALNSKGSGSTAGRG